MTKGKKRGRERGEITQRERGIEGEEKGEKGSSENQHAYIKLVNREVREDMNWGRDTNMTVVLNEILKN